ncbi:MAG: hypothetical protein CTY30_04065 [Methylocystis sp.]|nr:MAG: hypothetical protein CTY30_04065 [Methylocystis sp.]
MWRGRRLIANSYPAIVDDLAPRTMNRLPEKMTLSVSVISIGVVCPRATIGLRRKPGFASVIIGIVAMTKALALVAAMTKALALVAAMTKALALVGSMAFGGIVAQILRDDRGSYERQEDSEDERLARHLGSDQGRQAREFVKITCHTCTVTHVS